MRDREYFQRIKASHQAVISNVFISRVVRQPTVAVAAPIFTPRRRAVWRDCGNAGSISFRAIGANLRNAGPGGDLHPGSARPSDLFEPGRGLSSAGIDGELAAGEGSRTERRGVSGGSPRCAAAQCQVSGEPGRKRAHGLEGADRATAGAAACADRALLPDDGGVAAGRDRAVAGAGAGGGFRRDVAAGRPGESGAAVFGAGRSAGENRIAAAGAGRSGAPGGRFRTDVGAAERILHGPARRAVGSRAFERRDGGAAGGFGSQR